MWPMPGLRRCTTIASDPETRSAFQQVRMVSIRSLNHFLCKTFGFCLTIKHRLYHGEATPCSARSEPTHRQPLRSRARPHHPCHHSEREGRRRYPKEQQDRRTRDAHVGWMWRHRGHAPPAVPHQREAIPPQPGTKPRIGEIPTSSSNESRKSHEARYSKTSRSSSRPSSCFDP